MRLIVLLLLVTVLLSSSIAGEAELAEKLLEDYGYTAEQDFVSTPVTPREEYLLLSFPSEPITNLQHYGIQIADLDGSNSKHLLENIAPTVRGFEDQCTFLGDAVGRANCGGRKIVFGASYPAFHGNNCPNLNPNTDFVYVMNEDGSGLQDITPSNLHKAAYPMTNGKNVLVMGSPTNDYEWRLYLFPIDCDGCTAQKLNDVYIYSYAWSQDGTKIIFSDETGLFTADAEGANIQLLETSFAGANFVWIGDKIYYESGSPQTALYSMNTDGSNQQKMLEIEYHFEAFSPDLSKIYYLKGGGPTTYLFRSDLDGSNEQEMYSDIVIQNAVVCSQEYEEVDIPVFSGKSRFKAIKYEQFVLKVGQTQTITDQNDLTIMLASQNWGNDYSNPVANIEVNGIQYAVNEKNSVTVEGIEIVFLELDSKLQTSKFVVRNLDRGEGAEKAEFAKTSSNLNNREVTTNTFDFDVEGASNEQGYTLLNDVPNPPTTIDFDELTLEECPLNILSACVAQAQPGVTIAPINACECYHYDSKTVEIYYPHSTHSISLDFSEEIEPTPTVEPIATPEPTIEPTLTPTLNPTEEPTTTPTVKPTTTPTKQKNDSETTNQWWVVPVIILIFVVLLIIGVKLLKKKKPSTAENLDFEEIE